MSFFSKKKKKISPSNSAPAVQPKSQSVYPWSEHCLTFLPTTYLSKNSGPLPLPSSSPLPRSGHALSATATPDGELFLFGGRVRDSLRNDLYVISTRDHNATLLQTSGDAGEIPSPRVGHTCALIGSAFLVWGGSADIAGKGKPRDNSLYLFNLEWHLWTRVAVDGPKPVGRYGHAVTTVGSKLFVFGGYIDEEGLNDMWAFDLYSVNSNPVWESYNPAPGDKTPPPRGGHVLQTVGDYIVLFGGADSQVHYNDTWLFDHSTGKWTELPCTGFIPSPRQGHAAAVVGDIMYVFGGYGVGGDCLGDLTALNLLTQRWFMFQNIGPSPSGRLCHTVASEETRIFVLRGTPSTGARGDRTALIHVLDTKHIEWPNRDPNASKPIEKTVQPARKPSPSPPAQEQPQKPTPSPSDGYAELASPIQGTTPEELGCPAVPEITHDRNSSPNGLPSQPSGVNGKPRRVLEEDGDGEGSAEYRAKFAVPDASSEGEVARFELEQQLSAMLAAQTEREQRVAQLTDELASKIALLEQAEANTTEAMKHAERQLSATLAAQTERDQRLAQLTEELALKSALLELAEANAVKAATRAGLEHAQVEMERKDAEHVEAQARPDEAQSALQKAASCATDADERSQCACGQIGKYETELAEVRAKLEARDSELEAVRLRLMDAEIGWAKSKTEADTMRAMTKADLMNTDEDGIAHRLMERMRALEAEVGSLSLRLGEKSLEAKQSRNEG